jgi:hypothetical protein
MSYALSDSQSNLFSNIISSSESIPFQRYSYFSKLESGAFKCKKKATNECKGLKQINSSESSASRLQAHAEKCFGITFSSKRGNASNTSFDQKTSVNMLLKWLIYDAVNYFIFYLHFYLHFIFILI